MTIEDRAAEASNDRCYEAADDNFRSGVEDGYERGALDEHKLMLEKMRDWLDNHISDCVMRYNLVQQFDNDSKEW